MASRDKGTAATGAGKTGETAATPSRARKAVTASTKKPNRNTPGKQLLHGADRVVRYYKITEAEVDRLGELSADEKAAWARMAFCLGLAVNAALGLLFGVNLSEGTMGAAIALLVLSALIALRFFFDARKKKADGKSAFDKVKADHDFSI